MIGVEGDDGDGSSEPTQPRTELYLDELTNGASGTIMVMIYRSWDVHTITGRYLSTDFVMSNAKGNAIHSTAKANVVHNFLKLKEGSVYSIKNFVVQANKEEYCIFKDHAYMIELDGATSMRKTSVKGDVAGYVTNMGRITQQKSGFQMLDFSLANGSQGEVSLSQAAVHADYTQAKEGMLENLLVWAQNRKNDVRVKIDGIKTRKGWNFPSCGGEKCKKGMELPSQAYSSRLRTERMIIRPSNAESRLMASRQERDGASHYVVVRNVRKLLCERMEVSGVRRVTGKFRLELDIFDKTASTVVVMLDEPVTELVKCSIDSLSEADEDVGLAYVDYVGFPQALANIIGTTQTLEIESHMYYKHGWPQSHLSPLLQNLQRKGEKRVDLEDSDDEVICGMDDGQADAKDNYVSDKRKKKGTLWMIFPLSRRPKFQ
uniref:DUF223 domain-containing protein n=1 Tax=Tanacetum cinerariifolium TaxID=118510 RepID=A0A699HUF3_TANCI|nr:hypothetical protein [Tanacetum cinerariifolium]